MEAFHNDSLIKEKYITRLQAHYQADEIIKGQYWKNGKGCAVGCTIHSSNHEEYESKLGIPKDIAHLQDLIFEGLPNKLAKQFPLEFLSSINVGADLKNVKNLFTIWLLTDQKYGVIQYVDNKKVIQDVADAFAKNMISPFSVEEWEELRKNANDASIAGVYSDSKYDVYSSYSAAAYSVAAAAYSVFSTTALYYASTAYSAKNTKLKWYIAASNKLIELLKQTN